MLGQPDKGLPQVSPPILDSSKDSDKRLAGRSAGSSYVYHRLKEPQGWGWGRPTLSNQSNEANFLSF